MQGRLSSRDVPFEPGEGAARYSGLEGIQEFAWSLHSVAVQASVCIKAGVCMRVGRCERTNRVLLCVLRTLEGAVEDAVEASACIKAGVSMREGRCERMCVAVQARVCGKAGICYDYWSENDAGVSATQGSYMCIWRVQYLDVRRSAGVSMRESMNTL